jgi:alkaline phosphatase
MSDVDVAFGGGKRHFVNESNSGRRTDDVDVSEGLFPAHNWTVAYNKSDMNKVTVDNLPAIGLFASSRMDYAIDREYMAVADPVWDQPSLAEMTRKAVDLLEEKGGDDGFFIMVESSLVDLCGHWSDFACLIKELEAMEEALTYLVDYANARDDTTLVMMPDHETGGLALARGININNEDYGRIKSGGIPGTGLEDDMFKYETDMQANYIVPKGLYVKSYPYIWKPREMDGIEMSCKTVAGLAYADPDNIISIVSDSLGYNLSDTEKELLQAAVESSPGIGNGTSGAFNSYWGDNIVIYWAVAEIVNHRVGVSFVSHQHSSADVTLAGTGFGVDIFLGQGLIKNTDIGKNLAEILGVDLTGITAQLRQDYVTGVFDVCTSEPIYDDSNKTGKRIETLPDGNLRSGNCPGAA